MDTFAAPICIGCVALVVNDLTKMIEFYQSFIGLHLHSQDGETAVLGVGSTPLLELRQDKAARRYPLEAGLFHIAFLLPKREELGALFLHLSGQGVLIEGASDHLVSEALYVTDPEGNGIEVYWDRPSGQWQRDGDLIKMDTRPLNIGGLKQSAIRPWTGIPAGSVVGHVHLQVGDLATADTFMTDTLGLSRTSHLPSASWFGSGGYHHHLAANTWKSKGVGQRSKDSTGLAEIELLASSNSIPSGTLVDPWGNHFTITTAQSQAA